MMMICAHKYLVVRVAFGLGRAVGLYNIISNLHFASNSYVGLSKGTHVKYTITPQNDVILWCITTHRVLITFTIALPAQILDTWNLNHMELTSFDMLMKESGNNKV